MAAASPAALRAALRADLRFTLRTLARARGFAAVAILTLALGIGATTAIFGAVRAVVLRPFPYAHPERVVYVAERLNEGEGHVSDGNFTDWQRGARSFEHLAAERFTNFNIAAGAAAGGAVPERVAGGRVTHEFFAVFGARPALGRTFRPDEDEPGREQVVVLSHALWAARFAADPRVVGREVRLGARPYTVVGVMPEGFDPTLSGEQLWVPMALTPERRAQHDEHHNVVVGLLRPGTSLAQARGEMATVMRDLAARYPKDDGGRGASVRPVAEVLVGDYRGRLLVTLGAVSLVLLIACANVATLLLARGASRAKELAVRASLGAGRGRIVRQLLTESAALSLAAAAAGVVLAWAGLRALVALAPEGIPRLGEARVDAAVLLFAVAVALASSVVFGLTPALRAARSDPQGALREGGRGAATARDRVRTTLVAAEVALAFALLAGAGLLVRSALELQRVRPGFDPTGVVAARVTLPPDAYPEAERVVQAFTAIAERAAATPGVRAAAVVSGAPLGPGTGSNGLIPEGVTPDPTHAIDALLRIVTPGYFATMRVPLVRGRDFAAGDRAGAVRVMIVSEALARRAWPGQDPIGKRILCCEGSPDDPRWKTVVGVAADVRSGGPAQDVVPEFYLPIAQVPGEAWDWVQRSMTLVARGAAPGAATDDGAALTAALRGAVRAVDPALPIYGATAMGAALRGATAQARFNTLLLGVLGAVGLALAATGVYGVVAYFVSTRAREIGVRAALGATRRAIWRLVLGDAMRAVLPGVAAGLALAAAGTRLLGSMLHGVSPTDPAVLAATAAGLVAVGALASVIPARRAARVDPAAALRLD